MNPFLGDVEDRRGIVGLGGRVELRQEGGTVDYAKMEGLGEFAWLVAGKWKVAEGQCLGDARVLGNKKSGGEN